MLSDPEHVSSNNGAWPVSTRGCKEVKIVKCVCTSVVPPDRGGAPSSDWLLQETPLGLTQLVRKRA